MRRAIVLAAGGTGGHLFPAEALARHLLERGCAVHLATDRRADALADRLPGVETHRVHAGRLGGGPVRAACGLAELAFGVVQSRTLLRRLRPAAVVGFGGYPSVPVMLAASRLGLTTVIHEQNAVLGRANRLLARRVGRLALGFAETAGLRDADRARAVHTGNPVRPAILALGGGRYRPPSPDGPIELLVIGGSQGARALSEIVPPAVAALPAGLRARLRISQQARPEDIEAVARRYADDGIAAELSSFFADVPARLGRAHLVVCRAGASTIAELAAAGRPAILIPYPHATDDHQTANARAFAAAGGGVSIAQAELTPALLAERLAALLADPALLLRMAERAGQFAPRDAAERLAALILAAAPRAGCPPPQREERAA